MVRISVWVMLMMLIYWAEAYTIEKNKGALVVASKEIGLEVNAEKTKYMVMSRDQHAGQNHNIKILIRVQ
jgi:hypothetical protein